MSGALFVFHSLSSCPLMAVETARLMHRARLRTGRVLRGQPFMATRRQQLTYRVMLMEGALVAILLGLELGVNVVIIVRGLLRQQTVAGATSGLTLVCVVRSIVRVSYQLRLSRFRFTTP